MFSSTLTFQAYRDGFQWKRWEPKEELEGFEKNSNTSFHVSRDENLFREWRTQNNMKMKKIFRKFSFSNYFIVEKESKNLNSYESAIQKILLNKQFTSIIFLLCKVQRGEIERIMW